MSFSIGRRVFLATLGSAAAALLLRPLTTLAQQLEGMRRIGVLMNSAADDPESKAQIAGFRQQLQQLGWREDQNLHVEVRYAAGRADQYQVLAKELVAMQPDAMLAQGTLLVAALQRVAHTVPIVFTNVSDPVGSGFVANLARPGGNLTGFLLYEDGIAGKWLAMLKEIAPQLQRAAIIANPKDTPYAYFLRSAQAAAPGLGIKLVPSQVENAADIQQAIESIARLPNGGLVLPPDPTTISHRDLIIALAAKLRLPAVYAYRYFVTAGGLMCYDTDIVEQFHQAAGYVDRILRGEKPADLPVQAPTKYETVVNLKTAKAIGLDVPQSLLVRADDVIE